jgi:hypothetical protein
MFAIDEQAAKAEEKGLASEHTLHGDAAAITALLLVSRFGVGSFVAGLAPQSQRT